MAPRDVTPRVRVAHHARDDDDARGVLLAVHIDRDPAAPPLTAILF